jgi:hypothetical protein
MDQKRVFVSHSSQDNEFTKLLVAALRRAGADVWYDEDNLGAGVLRRKINDELATRPIVIVVISRAALRSTWVREECEWAYMLVRRDPGREIIPVVAAHYEPSDFNGMLFLEALRRIEAPDHSPLPSREAIARAVQLVGLPESSVVAALSPVGAAVPAATSREARMEDILRKAVGSLWVPREADGSLSLDANKWLRAGVAQGASFHTRDAFVALECALLLAPDDLAALAKAVRAAFDERQYLRAEEFLVRYRTLRPGSVEGLALMADVLWRRGQQAYALTHIDWAMAVDAASGTHRWGPLLHNLRQDVARQWIAPSYGLAYLEPAMWQTHEFGWL